MKFFILRLFLFLVLLQSHLAFSALLKDEQVKCTKLGGEVIESSDYMISKGLCGNRWTIWLSKGTDAKNLVVVDKVKLRSTTKTEKLIDSFNCYFQDNREKRLVFYGFFDSSKSGTVKNGKGKLVDPVYVADINSGKLMRLINESIVKIKCEMESKP